LSLLLPIGFSGPCWLCLKLPAPVGIELGRRTACTQSCWLCICFSCCRDALDVDLLRTLVN